MSSQDRPEATAAASAPAREPEARPTEPRTERDASNAAASGPQQPGGRRHPRRRHRSGERVSERGEREPHGGAQAAAQSANERELNLDELRELSDLIDAHGFTEFEIEREGFRLRISKHSVLLPPVAAHAAGAQPFVPPTITPVGAPPPAPAALTPATEPAPAMPAPPAETQPAPAAELHKITSPIVGTFYRAPSPTADSFVEIGSRIGPDTVVCIIEAMKLMNEIQADVAGTVEEIYVENGQPVEFGQALFGIRK
jgi:acetyl-CoA carboxylase biotin carboxyl carrier protein